MAVLKTYGIQIDEEESIKESGPVKCQGALSQMTGRMCSAGNAEPSWPGGKEYLIAQLIKIVESFLDSDKLVIQSLEALKTSVKNHSSTQSIVNLVHQQLQFFLYV